MAITTDTLAAIAPVRLSELSGVKPISSSAIDAVLMSNFSLVDGNASIVDVSTLGQVLAATITLLAQKMAVNSASSSNTVANSFATVATDAALFVNAFNSFQSDSTNRVQNPLTSLFNTDLLTAINAQNLPETGKNLLTSLAQIGISLQSTGLTDSNPQFTLNLTSLQAAFTADPTATSTLLTQALQALAQVETTLVSQNQSLSTGELTSSSSSVLAGIPASTAVASSSAAIAQDAQAASVTNTLQHVLSDETLQEAISANPAIVSSALDTGLTSAQEAEILSASATDTAATTLASASDSIAANVNPGATPASAVAANDTVAAQSGLPSNDHIAAADQGSAINNLPAQNNEFNVANAVNAYSATAAVTEGQNTTTDAITTVASELNNQTGTTSNGVTLAATTTANAENVANATDTLAAQTGGGTTSATATSASTPVATVSTQSSTRTTLAANSTSSMSADTASALAAQSALEGATTVAVAGASSSAATGASETSSSTSSAIVQPFVYTAINPAISAAVAAYKIGDAITREAGGRSALRTAQTVPDVGVIPGVGAVALNLHEQAGQQNRNGAAHGTLPVRKNAHVAAGSDVSSSETVVAAGGVDTNA
ncbi:MAG: hypothetical protein KGM99_18960 [Burkholderiales bacterium]|nr:hypothetical protein [Burkholderiales bacterium]